MRYPQWVAHHPRTTIACRVSLFPGFFVCLCRYSSPLLFNNDEVHGGSPHGAGTISGSDGSRMPSDLEKEVGAISRDASLAYPLFFVNSFLFPTSTRKRFYLRRPFWTRSRSQLSQLSSLLPPPIVCAFTFLSRRERSISAGRRFASNSLLLL